MIAEGDRAPDFAGVTADGKRLGLADFRGRQPLILYFYPRDNTPGCTKEACSFRDHKAEIEAAGAALVGVSMDSVESHQRFVSDHRLNFPLLSDPELTTHKGYGAWGMKTLYGKTSEGVIRSTYLIDREGRIARAWPNVKVDGHVDQVLAAIDALG